MRGLCLSLLGTHQDERVPSSGRWSWLISETCRCKRTWALTVRAQLSSEVRARPSCEVTRAHLCGVCGSGPKCLLAESVWGTKPNVTGTERRTSRCTDRPFPVLCASLLKRAQKFPRKEILVQKRVFRQSARGRICFPPTLVTAGTAMSQPVLTASLPGGLCPRWACPQTEGGPARPGSLVFAFSGFWSHRCKRSTGPKRARD